MENVLHILLVEDDPLTRRAVARSLRGGDTELRIHEESDGTAAISIMASMQLDCVFLDYQLPGIDGLSVLRAVRERGIKTPIVILTAKGDEELAVEMMRSGASDYVPKSHMTPERLSQSLRQAVRLNEIEKRAAEVQQRYRLLFEHSPYGVMIVDPADQRLIDFNTVAHQQLGYSRDELSRMAVWQLGVRTKEQVEQRMRINTARDRDEIETKWRTKAGELRDVLISVRPLPLEGKIYLHGIVQDITERNRLREQLIQSQKMEAIGRLAGGIAHDFNNLLAIISGYAESLTRRLGDDALLRSHAAEIQNAAERGGALTRQLLAFGRRQVNKPQPINLNTSIDRMSDMLRRVLSDETQLVIKLDPHLPQVEADAGQMEQVILNLVLNARDAMSDGGTLTITTWMLWLDEQHASMYGLRSGEYVVLSVADTGRGIEPEIKPHIFEPFFTTKEGKGTGLGLPIVYGIVQQAGGNVLVESEAGHGARFDIYLPALAAQKESK
jgi:two-component system cell cycle sensor histidine kinase/response regulator CckA